MRLKIEIPGVESTEGDESLLKYGKLCGKIGILSSVYNVFNIVYEKVCFCEYVFIVNAVLDGEIFFWTCPN